MWSSWLVHKFGGTSVADASCLMNVKSIVEDNLMSSSTSLAIVVSAMGGKPKVTDMLLDAVKAAASQDESLSVSLLDAVRAKHMRALEGLELLPNDVRGSIAAQIEKDLGDIENLLRAVGVMRSATSQIAELVSGYGETWSARILTALLRAAGHDFVYVDARDVLCLDMEGINGADRCGAVAWDASQRRLDALLATLCAERKPPSSHQGESSSSQSASLSRSSSSSGSSVASTQGEGRSLADISADAQKVNRSRRSPKAKPPAGGAQLVITGYIASTVDGAPTTLKRDGSDYSASIFGRLLEATEVHIWTDVDGVLSADPRRVPEAFPLEEVTYEEAMELAYFGAKVLHPKTMTPAVAAKIPLFIRNTFNPTGRGTRIGPSCDLARKSMMAGFTTVDDVAVINVCGTGMLGVPGVVFAAAGALKAAEISVRLIAQASSEMSIALAVDAKRANDARQVLEAAYDKELKAGEIAAVDVVQPCSIIAAVAQSLSADAPGRFYDALGRCGIQLVAAAQGCDERNLSAVVKKADARRALRAVHSAFLSHNVVALALVGAGFVGGHLLDAIGEAERMLMARFNVKLKICALVNADVMALAEPDETLVARASNESSSSNGRPPERGAECSTHHIDPASWRERLKTATTKSDFDVLIAHLERYRAWVPDIVVVDASYSLAVAEQHATWLRHQFHVVNANTRALAGPLDLFEQILFARDAAGPICYCSESCVGGGLPVIDTLRNLVLGGDTVRHVECVISASMSFIFSLISSPSMLSSGGQSKTTAEASAHSETTPLNGHALSGAAASSSNAAPTRVSFKEAVLRAWVMGLLENEPFLDLSGQDAATKLLALGRELGLALEPQHIRNEPVDGLAEILRGGGPAKRSDGVKTHAQEHGKAESNAKKKPAAHTTDFKKQYVAWRRGKRSCFEALTLGGHHALASARTNGDDFDDDELGRLSASANDAWSTPSSHERAVAIAGGAINDPSCATGDSDDDEGNQHNGLRRSNSLSTVRGGAASPRLFGWSAVESYDAKSLEVGYSRAEASGRALPIDPALLDAIDAAVAKRVDEAHARGQVLRHVGRIDVATGDVCCGLEGVDPNHAFAQLSGPELCVRFFTERYRAIPLTVNGPLFAAGMASGIFSELLRVVRHCSGHDRPYHLHLRRTRSMSKLQEELFALGT